MLYMRKKMAKKPKVIGVKEVVGRIGLCISAVPFVVVDALYSGIGLAMLAKGVTEREAASSLKRKFNFIDQLDDENPLSAEEQSRIDRGSKICDNLGSLLGCIFMPFAFVLGAIAAVPNALANLCTAVYCGEINTVRARIGASTETHESKLIAEYLGAAINMR